MAYNHLYSLLGSNYRFLSAPLHSATYSLLPGLWMDFHHLDDWHASRTHSILCIRCAHFRTKRSVGLGAI
ncbi:hypothetical protein THIOM_000074 [Candidatus Thiomargarita nelsonii]|uniref:Uncharacterized protein n=1 Tax=Candidatus Thiomargarita nelsonii TaxID=1003181 RepID=A0A176S833_9GAMM|nr:hypothetical protein THIOM_000074 [Candidatus Thiomargarita nelsonii]